MGLHTFRIKNGDIQINEKGAPVLLSGSKKASQDINEMLLTETNADGFGANLVKLLALVEEIDVVRVMVYGRITTAFDNLKRIQNAKDKSLRDANERFAEIKRLVVDTGDQPLSVDFVLDVLTDSGLELTKSVTVTA